MSKKRGRKALIDRPYVWHVNIEGTTAQKVELLLTDPVTGRMRYGGRSELITRLLERWLSEQITHDKTRGFQ